MDAQQQPQFTIREMQEADTPFIFNSYLKSFKKQMPFLSDSDYYAIHHTRFKRFLDSGATVFVVSPTDDPNSIAGWMSFKVSTTDVTIFYAYTKQVFRGFGIIKSCLDYLKAALPGHRLICLVMSPQLVRVQRVYNIQHNPYRLEE
jgi:hypothetical protein